MELFEEYPVLENERILIHKMGPEDAQALHSLANDPEVYRYLPTFLYEQKYSDTKEVLARMDQECFETRESILLGIYLKTDPAYMTGIAEIYSYEPQKEKASIGCRLNRPYWGQGIATEAVTLLRDYLMDEIGLRTITAHIMKENAASSHAVQKAGFFNKYPDQLEDWGFDHLLLIDKYVYKRKPAE